MADLVATELFRHDGRCSNSVLRPVRLTRELGRQTDSESKAALISFR